MPRKRSEDLPSDEEFDSCQSTSPLHSFSDLAREKQTVRSKKGFISLSHDDEGEEEGEPVEDVMTLSDEDEEEEAEEEEEEDAEKERATSGWGKTKATYYEEHRGAIDENAHGVFAENEEEEAKRLQRARAAALDEQDFAGSSATATTASSSTPATTVEKEMMKTLDKELKEMGAEKVEKDISGLTKEERLRIVSQDSPELAALLGEFKSKVGVVKDQLAPLVERVRAGDVPTSRGVTFLEVKYHVLLQYTTCLAFYLAMKARGRSVKDHPVVAELVRLRTVIEKMRPIERKLRYQIEKLLRAAKTGTVPSAAGNPLQFRANIGDLRDESEAEGEEGKREVEEEEEADGQKPYRPPKLRQVPYEGTTAEDKRKEKEAKMRKNAAKSSIMSYIRSEYGDAPEEERVVGAGLLEEPEADREKDEYEESRFARMGESRAEKAARKQAKLVDELGELEKFADIAALSGRGGGDDDDGDDDEGRASMGAEKKRTLSQAINAIAQESRHSGRVREKRMTSGDMDVPVREQPVAKRAKREVEDEEIPSDEASDGEGEEDVFYREAARQEEEMKDTKIRQKEKRKERAREKIRKSGKKLAERDEVQSGAKRGVTHRMQRNKGLLRPRSTAKSGKTSHMHLRARFEKKSKAAGAPKRDKSRPFRGEAGGIRPATVRSTKF